LVCHLQIDADPDPSYHLDPDFLFDADPQLTKMMRIRIHNIAYNCRTVGTDAEKTWNPNHYGSM
jgi:hypothetical protein